MLSRFRLNFSRCRRLVSALAVLTIPVLLFNLPALAAGDLDASFGQNGVTADPGFSGNVSATAVAIQPDRKIIAGGRVPAPSPAGNFPGFGLVRYLPNGAIDTTFGTNGRVITSFYEYSGTFATMNDIAVLPDGKIVVAGSVRVPDGSSAQYVIFVIRYNANGSLDTTFNGNGRLRRRQ